MTEDNLVPEHLLHVRGRVDQITEDMTDPKQRMTSLGGSMSPVKRDVAYGDGTDARHHVSLDKLVQRIERIERRLDLQEG